METPSIVFSGYFKANRFKDEAELIAYTTFTSDSALNVLENKDATYAQYHSKNRNEIIKINDDVIVQNMIRNQNEDNSITFVTVNSTSINKGNHFIYTIYIIIADFEEREEYNCGTAKMKSICFNRLIEEYDKYRDEINMFKDIGFATIDNL